VNLEEEYDIKLAELKAYLKTLSWPHILAFQFSLAREQGKKCPDDWVEIMDGQGNPTNNFRINNGS
jgi:hypothetical protein